MACVLNLCGSRAGQMVLLSVGAGLVARGNEFQILRRVRECFLYNLLISTFLCKGRKYPSPLENSRRIKRGL